MVSMFFSWVHGLLIQTLRKIRLPKLTDGEMTALKQLAEESEEEGLANRVRRIRR